MADQLRPDAAGPPDPGRREALKRIAALGLLALVDIGALSSCGRRALPRRARERKVIVLGLDGLSPHLVREMMQRGELPNLARLAREGGFRSLISTVPPQSPVAWASFITGRDPGGHGVYDFIERDPATYLPYLSIARTEAPHRQLSLGRWRLPLTRGEVVSLRRGRAFWDLLAERGVPCEVYRVPTNFPPQDTGARQLAGLGAPDLRGTYGEFSYFTEAPFDAADLSGGAVYQVAASNDRVDAQLIGPPNTLREGEPNSVVDFHVYLDREHRAATIAVQGQRIVLRQGEWSGWVPLRFEMIPHLRSVAGMCRFYLKQVAPALKLYVTPVNVDPMDPALPITAPRGFARDLADRFGRFYTQGFPQDVKALRHGVLDDAEYLHQSGLAFGEARRMYEAALDDFQRGLLFYYFSATDRTQHMFWRTMDPRHPAYDARNAREYGDVIPDCYRSADRLVGSALEAMDPDTTLIVLSDHGFSPFYREFNLNTWLADNGFLVGFDRWRKGTDIFSNADWRRTLAYGLGFNALYVNLDGREAEGCVRPAERDMIVQYLLDELPRVRDPETGARIIENVYAARDVYSSTIPERAPDLIVGYARGYRCADSSVLGEVTQHLVSDNEDKWSGDHCIDRAAVPGILVTSKPITAEKPDLPDIAATVLAEFGVEPEDGMTGRAIW